MKKITWLISVLIIGGVAGTLGSLWLAPALADFWPLSHIDWLKNARNGTTIINKTERVVVAPDNAFAQGVEKIRPALVGVRSYLGGKLVAEGNGFVLTTDGLVATSAWLLPDKGNYKIVLGGQEKEAVLLKKDASAALLKINSENLTPAAFVEKDNLFLAQDLLLVYLSGLEPEIVLNRGYLKALDLPELAADFYPEKQIATGAPVINAQGRVVALANVNSQREVFLVDSEVIAGLLSN
ncbi:MAG: hypothetical protein COU85_01185 [Candidatus Portnoybacteria bacterium CG10_big_fil_rev_8_21_14_0_10_44_7]|uniref:Serine protease n=1 Tax=Candidatus Portnoybacteria bacterium CG10_big_fil_rev_8_21_14_0_10_44_7 TaxID=1974816 RepID=A0A2M8KIZ5_9BACT|nr:MAG: hypothetical protein COU85_01185 [Candidatus Portnoybacteria bacterium CG10_big_fil_rev_8_21_14_0_10_44_7]